MNLTDISKKTDQQIKDELRIDLAKKRAREADEFRLKNLRAEVEVEEMWNFYDPDKKYRENLKRWLDEWADGSYHTYLEKLNNYGLPIVQVQCFDSPDLYEAKSEPYSSYKYQKKEDRKEAERDNRKSMFLAIGSIVGVAVIFGLLLLWFI